jgi:hypothetical protein
LIQNENRPVPLSPQQKIIAEQIRAIEESQGAIPHIPTASTGLDFSSWLQVRNQTLQQQPAVAATLQHAPQIFRRLLLAVLLIAALAGAVTCAKSLANAGTQLNIFWVLGVLLGLSWISLLLWLLTLVLHRDQAGLVAPMFSKLLERFLPERSDPTAAQAASRIWFRQIFFSRPGAMRLGWITHLIWSAYLLGGVVGLLLLFTTRQFDFVWESTLLDGGSFVRFTHWLTPPLATLGLPVPDATQVLTSRIDNTTMDTAANRRTWALFLLGCVMIYGLLPRLLVGIICLSAEWRLRTREQLDMDQSYYVKLQREFWPQGSRARVLDADTHPPAVQNQTSFSVTPLPQNCLWLGLELPQQFPLPDAARAQVGFINILDERALEQARIFARTKSAPVALLIDSNKAADRGLLRIVTQLAESVGTKNLWLVLPPHTTDNKWQSWLQTAARVGLTPEQVTAL